MYLTAHRVHSRAHGRAGINVFRYLHGSTPVPGMSWNDPDLALIAGEYPGQLDANETEVPPGGNEVLSYLDVVAADGTAGQIISSALDVFRERVAHSRPPLRDTIERVAIQFGCVEGAVTNLLHHSGQVARRLQVEVRDSREGPRGGPRGPDYC